MRKRMTSIATVGLATVLSLSVTLSQPSLAEAATKSKAAATKSKAAAKKTKAPVKKTKAPVVKPTRAPAKPTPAPAKPKTTTKATSTAVVLSATDIRLLTFVDSTMARLRSTAPVGAAPGTWKGSGGCWRCDAGPAMALAAASALTEDPVRREEAERIFDYHLTTYQRPNGAFGTTVNGSDIDTTFFANELGMSAILLKPTMDPARYARWSNAVARAADFLIVNKNLAWYTNGNIVLSNALTMALAHRLTGDAKYATAYETAITFAASPPQWRWPGRGLVTTVKGVLADGSDSKGYFTEEGARGIGYDPEYTHVQMDFLGSIMLVNGDSRARNYLNMVTNQLNDRLDKATWRLDNSGGTRKGQVGTTCPFDTGAYQVLGNLGGRADLQSSLRSHEDAFVKSYAPMDGDRLRAAFGWTAAMAIMSQPASSRLR